MNTKSWKDFFKLQDENEVLKPYRLKGWRTVNEVCEETGKGRECIRKLVNSFPDKIEKTKVLVNGKNYRLYRLK